MPRARVTRQQVASRAGVSVATVSYVLNGRQDVKLSPQTRERVLAAARELGYRLDPLGRALATGRSHVVALWTAQLRTPHYAHLIGHMHESAASRGFRLIVGQWEEFSNGQGFDSTSWPVDGVIAYDFGAGVLGDRQSVPIPIVAIGFREVADHDWVEVDLRQGAQMAVEHLLSRGCRRVAHVVSEPSLEPRDPRTSAYEACMVERNLSPELICASDQLRPSARQAVRRYVTEHGLPDGLFCINDEMALGAYRGLCDLGVRVPQQTMLVGYDGIEDTEYLECPLTTVVQPVEAAVQAAWEMLMRRLREPQLPPQRLTLRPRLAVRDSTRRNEARGCSAAAAEVVPTATTADCAHPPDASGSSG